MSGSRYEVSARILAIEHEASGDVVRLHRRIWLTTESLEPEPLARALRAALERTGWQPAEPLPELAEEGSTEPLPPAHETDEPHYGSP